VDLRSGEVGHLSGRHGGGGVGQHLGDLPGGDGPDSHPWSRARSGRPRTGPGSARRIRGTASPQDRRRDAAAEDQLLLAPLAHVVAGVDLVDADDRQDDVMADAGLLLDGEQA
jgi:hypothetical protein